MATPVQRAVFGIVVVMVLVDSEADVAELDWISDRVRRHGYFEGLSDDAFHQLGAAVAAQVQQGDLRSSLDAWCAELAGGPTAPIAYELALTAMFTDGRVVAEEVGLLGYLQERLGLSQEVATALQAVVMSRR
jgi:hypothetical protein